MKNKRYFPMFIDLSDKKIVVVGGGNIATRRVKTLAAVYKKYYSNCTEIVTYGAQELGKTGYVNLITRPVKRSDFAMAYMVIAATNDWKLNDEITVSVRKRAFMSMLQTIRVNAISISRVFI